MPDTGLQPPRLSEPVDAEVTEYRAISGLAVAALGVGLLSAVALVHPLLWTVPMAGVLLGVLSLRRIAALAPSLIGRKAAVAGLVLSGFFFALGPADRFTYQHLLAREAEQFALQWFELLRQQEPARAMQLSRSPEQRKPLDKDLEDYYAPGSEARHEFESFVNRPEVRSLMAIGPQAEFRYYASEGQYRDREAEVLHQVYAVTWVEGGRKKTYFLRLILKRYELRNTGHAYWQVSDMEGGIRPKALGQKEAGQPG